MKKYIPFILSFLFFSLSIFYWDIIKIPYDISNEIIGDLYFKKINPFNNILRFLVVIIGSTIIYFTLYLIYKPNTFNIIPKDTNYFLAEKNFNKKKNNFFFYSTFFYLLIVLEFLIIDFSRFVGNIDLIAESAYIVPPINFIYTKKLFQKTFYDYGLIGNNLAIIFYLFKKNFTIGDIIFLKLLLILGIKFFLIKISFLISSNLNLQKNSKKLFILFFCYFCITLPNYYDMESFFNIRAFLYLAFIFLLIKFFLKKVPSTIDFLLLGSFSLISVMWWLDIGAYVNALLIFTMIYCTIHKRFKDLCRLSFSIIFIWFAFLLIMPTEELNEFFYQISIIYSDTYNYLLGLEYKKPFTENSGRWTKAIVFLYVVSLLIIKFLFDKKYCENYDVKISIIILYVSSIFLFKSALFRSDSYHLKYTSGLYTIILFFLFLYFIFTSNFLKNLKKKYLSKLKYCFYLKKLLTAVCLILFFNNTLLNNKFEISSTLNKLKNSKSEMNILLSATDFNFISKNIQDVVERYKTLSIKDECIQTFSDDFYFSYFLKKKTCAKIYTTPIIIKNKTENKFLNEFEKNAPNIILFKSPTKIFHTHENLYNTLKFINNNYYFYENYKGYIFYKKK